MYSRRPYSRPHKIEFKNREQFDCDWEDFITDEKRTVVDAQELGDAKKELAEID